MRKLLAGLGSLILILAWVIGFPVVLFLLAGNPFPTAAQWNAIITLTPDYGNIILLTKVLPLVLWVIWAAFTAPFLLELLASFRGVPTRKKFRATRWQQNLSAGLIGAVALTFAGLGGLSGAAPANAATVQSVSAGTVASAPVVRTPIQQTPAQQAPPTVHDEQVTVQEGDTLFGISERVTGDGNNYPEIVEATQGVQPDGQTLTDPDLILPGWVMNVPVTEAAAPAPPPVIPVPAPAPDSESAAESASGPSSLQPDAQEAGTTSAASGPAITSESDLAVALMTAGGVGGVLAAGLITALEALRLQQRRRRRKGERIALPDEHAEQFEREMRWVEDPASVAAIDSALRGIQAWAEEVGASLPELLAVRVASEEIALYLAAPAALPAPFESSFDDDTVWTVRTDAVDAPGRRTVSPYPALATVGVDAQGGLLLLNLEQVGSLNVSGDERAAQGMLRALAVELTQNPWSDNIRVTLVGMGDAVPPGLDPNRIRAVEDVPALVRNLRADLEDRQEALDSYGVDGILEARSRASDVEGWAPHVVLMAQMPLGSIRQDLADLVMRTPSLGIATFAQGNELLAGARIAVTSANAAEYRSGGMAPPLPFRPQVLTGDEWERLRELLATTQLPAQPADLAAEGPGAPAFDADEREPDTNPITIIPWSVATATEPPAAAPDWAVPYVRLLGPVDVLNIDGELPPRGIEFLSFLLLQGTPSVPGTVVQGRLWPGTPTTDSGNSRRLAAQVRAALGNAPDGAPLLPEARRSGGYPVPSHIGMDWLDFCRLIGPDLDATTNENLASAIRLVRGQPFAGVSRRKGWWMWRPGYEETMRAAILDAADELTRRALRTGDFDSARLGAAIAQSTDPRNEAGWRLAIETAMAAGDITAFHAIVDAMFDVIGPDQDAEEQTRQLIDEALSALNG